VEEKKEIERRRNMNEKERMEENIRLGWDGDK